MCICCWFWGRLCSLWSCTAHIILLTYYPHRISLHHNPTHIFNPFYYTGSEEHYYVSLLYNWPRTRAFVQSLSAQIVWNTWELGLWEQQQGFQTHTHFLSLNEIDILAGNNDITCALLHSTKRCSSKLSRSQLWRVCFIFHEPAPSFHIPWFYVLILI